MHGIILLFASKVNMRLKASYYKIHTYFLKIKNFLTEFILSSYDFFILKFGIGDNVLRHSSTNPIVLFVGREPNFRIQKMMKYLMIEKDIDVKLLIQDPKGLEPHFKNLQNTIFYFRNKFHLKRILHNAKVDRLIAFSSRPSYAYAALSSYSGMKFFDAYDSLVVYYGLNPKQKWMRDEMAYEKKCFSTADFLIARNLEVRQSLVMYGLNKKKSILFSDYCDNELLIKENIRQIDSKATINIAYSGGLYGKSARKSSHGIENFDELIYSLPENNVNLHLYPSPNLPIHYYFEFIDEAKVNPHLKIYDSLPQKELCEDLSKYHFGILPHFKDDDSRILDYKLRYGTSNKFFNFLEAGIPIIVSGEMTYMAWMVKRYKIGIVISRNDLSKLRQIILSTDYAAMKSNVYRFRQKLSMNENLPRLRQFILDSKKMAGN